MLFDLPEELNNQMPSEFYSEKELNNIKYQLLLENNILGISQSAPQPVSQEAQENQPGDLASSMRVLQFRSPSKQEKVLSCSSSSSPLQMSLDSSFFSSFKTKRKIPEKPFKILEAPSLKMTTIST